MKMVTIVRHSKLNIWHISLLLSSAYSQIWHPPLPCSIPIKTLHLLLCQNMCGNSSQNLLSNRTWFLMNVLFLVHLVILYLLFNWKFCSVLRLGYRRHHYHHTNNSTAISNTKCWEQMQPRHPLVIFFIILSLSLLEISYHCYYHYSAANHTRIRTIVHKKCWI